MTDTFTKGTSFVAVFTHMPLFSLRKGITDPSWLALEWELEFSIPWFTHVAMRWMRLLFLPPSP